VSRLRTQFVLLSLCWLFVVCSVSFGADLSGEVVGVHDGDTITVLTVHKRSVKVRLYGIDAPESNQPYGSKAKQRLSELVFGKRVRVETHGTDRYRRTLGVVYLNDKDINAQMVSEGLAWAYVRYSSRYVPQQEEAKSARRNIWSQKNPTPPWEFRRVRSSNDKVTSQQYVVYITRTGKKYHRAGCRYLRYSAIPISLSEARRLYEPCKVCIGSD
jgi:endonuclease YncB( thermonuclease family)